MLKTKLVLIPALGWALAQPAAAVGITDAEARHLLARTGFGGTAAEIAELVEMDYARAVGHLLDSGRNAARTEAPAWVNETPPNFRKIKEMSQEQRRSFRKKRRQQALELKGWWYQEMINSDSPLTERMTLFWHNHFTSSLRKVRWPALMYRQNLLLRHHALGNFRELLHAVSKDPAMILYLDNQTNRKGKPNENFAREVLELFTLGESHYSERDIKEAARAFTGWMVDRRTGRFRFNPRRHDSGVKTFMGRTGAFDGDDILDIILEQRQVAVHITETLWREFVSDTPNRQEVERLASIFRERNYEIKPLLKGLLMSSHFRTPENRGTLVKSPVELIVGTFRFLRIPVNSPRQLARLGRYLGQNLLDPPNVKGWPGGNAWITTSTLLARQHFLERVVRGKKMPSQDKSGRQPAMRVATRIPMTPARTANALALESGLSEADVVSILLPIPPVNPPPQNADLQALIGHLMLDPAYQLK